MTVQAESIFVDQSELTLQLTLNKDITGASVDIQYKKPISGTVGHWHAQIDDEATGVVHYDFLKDAHEIDEKGNWFLWLSITFSDQRWAPSISVIMYVQDVPGLEV
jgi:hypothetical protein